ncbi:MAG: hypothetical protein MUF00_10250 [Gemmatimonadaceae bacterium]|jgi:hypothetical protein|nr:hypothetical protein [Gemmatimonadaceae bacterium]
MRRIAPLAAFAALAAVATSAAAQTGAAQTAVARTVASYAFQSAPRDVAFPHSVVVTDSAGTLVAAAFDARRQRQIPLNVTVLQSDLILQGRMADGDLTLILNRGNDGPDSFPPRGIWTLGERQGALVGGKRQ